MVFSGPGWSADDEKTKENPSQEPTYELRPHWEPGKRYRWLQRLDTVVTVAGLGKQRMEWRQHIHITAGKETATQELEIGIESIRVDMEVTGNRSRYYFDQTIPLRFQDRKGIQGMLLKHTEDFVRNRYRLSLSEDGEHKLIVIPPETSKEPKEANELWSRVPWEALTSALLHQGIPNKPLEEGATWQHTEELAVAPHGQAEWRLDCEFNGFKEHEGSSLALIQFKGSLNATFHQDQGVEDSPGISIKLSKARGLTLIDSDKKLIASTVIKLDGKLHSLGLPGAAEGETAPLKQTITLSLLDR
jgi:hypothetical protein